MNVLLIAPDLGLPAALDEVRAVSAALRPVILSGEVRRRDVLEALRGHTWHVVWFATHGDSTGIQLSDGPIAVSDLTAVVRASGAWLVVLNTCSSRLIGLELHYELGVSVITTQAEVTDATAYQTGALLAQALAENSDPVAAFSASKPGQGQNYLLFHSGHDERTETKTILMLNEWGSRLSSKIDEMDRRFGREIKEMRQEMDALSGNVRQAVRLPVWHRVVFAAAFGMAFLPTPLFFDPMRDLLDVGWQAALILTAGAYLFSALLWSYMWWGGEK